MPEAVQMATQGALSPALRRLGQCVLLSQQEIDFFEGMQNNVVAYKRGETMLEDGQPYTCCFCIRSGWAISYRITAAGRRQIVSVFLPGDFIGLHINFSRQAIFSIDALTDLDVALIEPMRLIEIHQKFPILASGLDWSAVRNLNILGEHNVSMGARTADQRILHFLLELWCRLLLIGEASSDGFVLRMTQQQLADALGLSLVHTNKMLKALERRDLIAIENRMVSVPDLEAAIKEADFDPAFLETFRTASLASTGYEKLDERLEQIANIAEKN
jgi:CRP-like cAMP-binding protein